MWFSVKNASSLDWRAGIWSYIVFFFLGVPNSKLLHVYGELYGLFHSDFHSDFMNDLKIPNRFLIDGPLFRTCMLITNSLWHWALRPGSSCAPRGVGYQGHHGSYSAVQPSNLQIDLSYKHSLKRKGFILNIRGVFVLCARFHTPRLSNIIFAPIKSS